MKHIFLHIKHELYHWFVCSDWASCTKWAGRCHMATRSKKSGVNAIRLNQTESRAEEFTSFASLLD